MRYCEKSEMSATGKFKVNQISYSFAFLRLFVDKSTSKPNFTDTHSVLRKEFAMLGLRQ